MRYIILVLLLSFTLSSCFLISSYRRQQFHYTHEGASYSVPFVVPRGYNKKWTTTDEAGNTVITYSYRKGPVFYLAHMVDTSVNMQPVSDHENMPHKSLTTEAIVYKGMDDSHLYWREVRHGKFRMGYRFVETDREHVFDSATNYLVVRSILPEARK